MLQRANAASELRRRLLITLLEVLFFYFPSLLTTTLNLFACFHIDPSGPANAQYHNAQVTLTSSDAVFATLPMFCTVTDHKVGHTLQFY